MTTFERAVKWSRRHPAHAALVGVSVVALIAVGLVSAVMNVRLSRAHRTIAERAETQRRDLARLHTSTGNRLAEEGDPLGALRWFAEAARLDAGDAERVAMHRLRFGITRRHAPELARVWSAPEKIVDAALSGDGLQVALAAGGEVRVVATETGAVLATLPHAAPVSAASFDPQGLLVATRTATGLVQLWDVASGATHAGPWRGAPPLVMPHGLAHAVEFSPDGQSFLLLEHAGARLHRVHALEESRSFFPHAKVVNRALFSPDGTRILTASEDHTAVIWDAATGAPVMKFTRDLAWRNAAWSPDGTRIALCDDYFRAAIFDAGSGARISEWLRSGDMVLACLFSPDGTRVLTFSTDNTVRVFDSTKSQPLFAPRKHRSPVRAAAWSPDGRTFASGCFDGSVRVWDAITGEPRDGVLRHGAAVTRVAFARDPETVLTAGADGLAKLWNFSDRTVPWRKLSHDTPVDAVAFSPSGERLVTIGLKKEARLWPLADEHASAIPLVHPARATAAVWVGDTGVRTGCMDGILRTWDAATGELRGETPLPISSAQAYLRFSPDGSGILAAAYQKDVRFASTSDGTERWKLPADKARNWISFGARGRRLLESRGSEVQWRDAAGGQPSGAPIALSGPGHYGIASPDERRLAFLGPNFTVWIADAATGQRVAGPLAHFNFVRDVAFAPDGRTLATVSDDAALRLWDATTGEPLGPPLQHPARVVALGFSPDGARVATASSDGFARVWEIPIRSARPCRGSTTSHRRCARRQRKSEGASGAALRKDSGAVSRGLAADSRDFARGAARAKSALRIFFTNCATNSARRLRPS